MTDSVGKPLLLALVLAFLFGMAAIGAPRSALAQEEPPSSGLPTLSVLDLSVSSSTTLVLYERLDWNNLKFDLLIGTCDTNVCSDRHTLVSQGSMSFDGGPGSKGSLEQGSDQRRVVYTNEGLITVATCSTQSCESITARVVESPVGVEITGLATVSTSSDEFRIFISSSNGLYASECSDTQCSTPTLVGAPEGIWGLGSAANETRSVTVAVTDDGSTAVLNSCPLSDPIAACRSTRVDIDSPNPLPLEAFSQIHIADGDLPVVLTRRVRGESVVIRCSTPDCFGNKVLSAPTDASLIALAPVASDDVLAFGAMDGGGVQTVRCDFTRCGRASYPVLDYGPNGRIAVDRDGNGELLIALESTDAATPVLQRCDSTCDAGSSRSPLSIDFQGLGGTEARIARLYAGYFQRDPDSQGFAFWYQVISSGEWTNDRASDHFAASPEFQQTYGEAVSDLEFLSIAYANVFDRQPDPEGEQYWLDRMSVGLTPGQVLLYFSDSSEFRDRTRTR